jgi:hypothetical protein
MPSNLFPIDMTKLNLYYAAYCKIESLQKFDLFPF